MFFNPLVVGIKALDYFQRIRYTFEFIIPKNVSHLSRKYLGIVALKINSAFTNFWIIKVQLAILIGTLIRQSLLFFADLTQSSFMNILSFVWKWSHELCSYWELLFLLSLVHSENWFFLSRWFVQPYKFCNPLYCGKNINFQMSSKDKKIKHVVIVGAGIAGLTCARELSKYNKHLNVTILEASDRIWGRVKSIEAKDGTTIEMGAQFIHGTVGNPIFDYAVEKGIINPHKNQGM